MYIVTEGDDLFAVITVVRIGTGTEILNTDLPANVSFMTVPGSANGIVCHTHYFINFVFYSLICISFLRVFNFSQSLILFSVLVPLSLNLEI